jgi:hypothetical protein
MEAPLEIGHRRFMLVVASHVAVGLMVSFAVAGGFALFWIARQDGSP